MSLILRAVTKPGQVSRNQIVVGHQDVKIERIDEALVQLEDVGVVKSSIMGDGRRYRLRSFEESGPKDFLVLKSSKRVTVSATGNRAVRLRNKLMAVHNDVQSRPCGSVVWSDKVSAPKYRLGPTYRRDPLSDRDSPEPKFETVKREKNNLGFKINFDPPLSAGEVVDFGFYVWIKNHYPLTRKEALERYNDEWTREGMAINDPCLRLSIKVNLPEGFRYKDARVEKDPVLTQNGPNVPGSLVDTFKSNERILAFNAEKPSPGHYFVSWVST